MEIEHFLKGNAAQWMSGDQVHGDIVMSTRIRLARNIRGYRYPRAFSEDEAFQIDQMIRNALIDAPQYDFAYFHMQELSNMQKKVLMEKHLISPQLAEKERIGSVFLSADESISVMINEEDHIRLQCLKPGLQIDKAYKIANALDDYLDSKLPYAFDEQFGYLSCCPTNTGTGLRASIMMHLPALTMTNQIQRIVKAMPRIGMVVRGLYGEGSEAVGNYYQISNQVTLGRTEEEIMTDLQTIAEQIVHQETEARQLLLSSATVVIDDKVNRSLGLLSYARLLTTQEAADCLSNVRLGIDLGLVENMPIEILNNCMLAMQSGFLQQQAGTTLKAKERDQYRATLLREMIHQKNIDGEKGEGSYDV